MSEWGISFTMPAEAINANKAAAGSRFNSAGTGSRQLVQAWRDAAYYAACRAFPATGPSGRRLPPCDVYLVIPVKGEHRRDPHNWYPTVKAVVDGLTRANLWPDDNEDWVTTHEPSLFVIPPTSNLWAANVYVRLVSR